MKMVIGKESHYFLIELPNILVKVIEGCVECTDKYDVPFASVDVIRITLYIYKTADSKHCFDVSGLVSAVGVTDIFSRRYMLKKDFYLEVCL